MSVLLYKAAAIDPIVENWGSLTWLASCQVANVQDMTLGRVVIKYGQSNSRHCHPDCEEVLYPLTSRLEHSLSDKAFTLEVGDMLAIPTGVFHHADSVGDVDADTIVAYSAGERGFVLEEP